jgi:hypothetical protein
MMPPTPQKGPRATLRRVVPSLLAGLIVALAGGPARAQFGWGWGWGYQTPSVVESIYSRSNIAAGAAYANRQQNLTAPARPARDVTFFERYDPETLQRMEDRVARNPRNFVGSAPSPTAVAAAVKPVQAAVQAITGYFNQYQQVVWPSDAPTEGDLLARRTVSDDASRSVLKEFNADGLAKVATVTDARNKLLDYGRPALQFARTHTPAVADSFHAFLLSLYDALGRAATTPKK